MSIELSDLPYAASALEPHISERTMSFHYGKHHAGYVKKLNAAIDGSDYAGMDLEAIIVESNSKGDQGVFNNAAQVLNHDQYWLSMTPDGAKKPGGALLDAIERDFGSFDKLVEQMKSAAAALFGSGWVWLASDDGKLEIVSTQNAETPLTDGKHILMTIDVWEHAYYLDYQNDRPGYIDIFFDHLANWDRASALFDKGGNQKAA